MISGVPQGSVLGPLTFQGVIQDFEVEGGSKKSNYRIKKGQLLFQYPVKLPAMDPN